MLTVLDLFSGIGGFSLGLERTGGFKTVAFCEIDPFCRKVLAKHWPDVPIHEDITTLRGEDVGSVDVIAGGFPCQDISCAGPRTGIDGQRSGLWREYARLVGEIQPRFVIVENTADLLVRGMDRVLGDLATLGYDAEWHCIPAAAVGADHWRDRCWIVSYPDGSGAQSLHQQRGQQRSEEVGEDVADDNGARLPGRRQAGSINQDAGAISPWIGSALRSSSPFPGLDGAGSPVLGRGENGIPDRVDRIKSLGNAVVPQVVEVIGNAILEAA